MSRAATRDRLDPHLRTPASQRTPYSVLSGGEPTTLCARFKSFCFNFKRTRTDSDAAASDAPSDFHTVSSMDYDECEPVYAASYMSSARSQLSSPGTRPGFLSLANFNCITTPVFTPAGPPEPIVIDMADFELIFEPMPCDICTKG